MPLTRRSLIASSLTLPMLGQRCVAAAKDGETNGRIIEARAGTLPLLADKPAPTPIWGYDGQSPGPLLRLKSGEELRLRVVNKLDQPTSLHIEGLRLPNALDGVGGLTQKPVAPGENFDLRTTPRDSGTFWYRPGIPALAAEQKGRGLHGLLVIEETQPPSVDADLPVLIDDWLLEPDGTQKASFLAEADVRGEGRIGTLVTINGQTLPIEQTFAPGSRLRLRIANGCNARFVGLVFDNLRPFVVAVDGQPCDIFEPAQNTIPVGPGGRFDVLCDLPTEAGVVAKLVARGGGLRIDPGGEADRDLMVFHTDGTAHEARPPIAGLPPNPQLPAVIRLEKAKRMDLSIEPGTTPDLHRAWTLNGVAGSLDAKSLFRVPRGQPVSLGFVNRSRFVQTMHLHGHAMRVLHPLDDGWEPYWRDTIIVPPGKTVRVAFVADNPGKWLIESAILEHLAGGLWTWFEVA